MIIAVIDGQGGGIGAHIVEKLRKSLPEEIEIIALGTNAVATQAMMKAGANRGASGENAILYNLAKVDLIVGTIGIIMPNSMMGELTPKIAETISTSSVTKILLPLEISRVEIAGIGKEPLPHLIDKLVAKVIAKTQKDSK